MSDSEEQFPGSKRCPTFKDYSEQIKQLQHENFQLRIRVFLSEQKSGVKTSSSDFQSLIQQNRRQLQCALNLEPTETSLNSSSVSSHELSSYKAQNEQLHAKISELEQKLAHTITSSRSNDDEIDTGTQTAFGCHQCEQGVEVEQELQMKLEEQMLKVRDLEDQLFRHKEAITKLEKKATKLEDEKQKLTEKFMECSNVFVEMGRRNMALSLEVEEWKKVAEEKLALNSSNLIDSSVVQEKYDNVREVVSMLQGRMKEVIAFVDAIFRLESKNVFHHIGLQDENVRNRLQTSMEQCRHFSNNLDSLFHRTDLSVMADKRVRFAGSNLSNSDYMSFNGSFKERRDAGDLDPAMKPRNYSMSSKEIQCELLSSKLHRDLYKSEASRKKLLEEQRSLICQIETLQASLHKAYREIQDLQKVTRNMSSQTQGALEMENSALLERLSISDSALRQLHKEHAKLVALLKNMPNIPDSVNQEKLMSSYTESERPSDATSPDLGIDSGHDGAANSDDSHGIDCKKENSELKKRNRELAQKLRQTRQALDNTLEKLHSTAKQKEEVERAICRQLHKTHTILRQAKKSVEKFTANQENLVPS